MGYIGWYFVNLLIMYICLEKSWKFIIFLLRVIIWVLNFLNSKWFYYIIFFDIVLLSSIICRLNIYFCSNKIVKKKFCW